MESRHSLIVFVFVFVLFVPNSSDAQKKIKEIKFRKVEGMAVGGETDSPDKVKQRAINEAKAEALKQAGVEETIISFSDYFQSEENFNYEDFFTSDILSDMRGTVKEVEVVDEERQIDENGNLKIAVQIDGVVVKYKTENDVTFDAWVNGMGMFYQNGQPLKFSIKPSKDCFVKIFIVSNNENESFLLYPNEYEPNSLLKANQEYEFPRSIIFDYLLETNKKSEVHRAIMVFTKKDVPYTKDVEFKSIIDWIFTIPPDMRLIKSFGFSVVNEDKMK